MNPPPAPGPGGTEFEVLVVDDSAVVRQKLKSIIESDPRFYVTLAGDPYEAATMLSRSVPRASVLDVEMPRMDGLTFLQKLMRQHPLPVVLCTSIADRALSALEMGALEVIPKPDWRDPAKMAAWAGEFMASLSDAAGIPRLLARDDKATSADAILPRRSYAPARRADRSRSSSSGSAPAGCRRCPSSSAACRRTPRASSSSSTCRPTSCRPTSTG